MRRPRTLLRCSEALSQLLDAAFTRRALRPGNVASGDRCVRGTLAPRHHAGTNNLLSKALGATGRKAALAPRHYRIPAPGDRPRKALSAASGRRSGSDGALRLRPPAPRTLPRRGSSSRWRASPPCRASRVRRAQAAPAALDGHPPHQRCAAGTARPHRHDAAVGRRLFGIDGREVARRRERRTARARRDRRRLCDGRLALSAIHETEVASLVLSGPPAAASSRGSTRRPPPHHRAPRRSMISCSAPSSLAASRRVASTPSSKSPRSR